MTSTTTMFCKNLKAGTYNNRLIKTAKSLHTMKPRTWWSCRRGASSWHIVPRTGTRNELQAVRTKWNFTNCKLCEQSEILHLKGAAEKRHFSHCRPFFWMLYLRRWWYDSNCYETILSGQVMYAGRRCNAGVLSVYLTHILYINFSCSLILKE